MNNPDQYIPDHTRALLKRLCPYQGASIPEAVRRMGKGYWGPEYPEQHGHWHWDDGDGDGWQYVLHLCDMDSHTCDPAGHVANRPIKDGECLLMFFVSVGRPWGSIPIEDFVFPSPEAAKAFLDPLLAYSTPPLPGYYPGDDDWTNPDR
jgi:hypothetical protein